MIFFILAGVFIVVLGAGYALAFYGGRTTEKGNFEGRMNDAAKKAAVIRDRLHHDDHFAKRVRERFTR